MTATVRITGDGASVDGRLVEVPAGLDPVRCCLDRVCRDDGPVRALIVDERDAWEYRVVVHPDGRVEEDLDPPPAVRVAARRWRVGPVAAVVAVLAVASWLAVDAARTEPPSSSPGSTVLQGAVPLSVPLVSTTLALTTTSSPAPAPAPTTTTRAAPTTTSKILMPLSRRSRVVETWCASAADVVWPWCGLSPSQRLTLEPVPVGHSGLPPVRARVSDS